MKKIVSYLGGYGYLETEYHILFDATEVAAYNVAKSFYQVYPKSGISMNILISCSLKRNE